MTETEIKEMAVETYELGVKMGKAFACNDNDKDYMIMAIYACITGIVNKPIKKR